MQKTKADFLKILICFVIFLLSVGIVSADDMVDLENNDIINDDLDYSVNTNDNKFNNNIDENQTENGLSIDKSSVLYEETIQLNEIKSDSASLKVEQIVSSDSVNTGDELIYTIVITNNGTEDITGLYVLDFISEGLDLNDVIGAHWIHDGDKFIYNATLLIGENTTLALVFGVNGKITGLTNNTIYVYSEETGGKEYTSDNTEFKDVVLTISKSSDVTNANVGEYVTYTITVTNTGKSTATGVSVYDLLPTGLDYVNHLADKWTKDGNYYNLDDDLAAGESVNLTIYCLVDGNAVGNIVNNANVTSNEFTEGVITDSNVVDITDVNIIVIKTTDVKSANIGDEITYTITITNDGSTSASGITLNEIIPNGLDFIGGSGNGWSSTPDGVLWTYANELASKGTTTLTITFKVNGKATGEVSNEVSVSNNQTIADTSNSSENTDLTNVTLEITKTSDVNSVNIGETVTYTITVSNSGSTGANGVYIRDVIPDGFTYDSHNDAEWDYDGISLWTFNDILAGGADAVLTLVLKANGAVADEVSNTAYAGSDEISYEVNATSDDVLITTAILDVTKDVDVNTANVGDEITYTITITNNGNGAASNIVVSEYDIIGLELITQSVSGWTKEGNNWIYSGSLAEGDDVQLKLIYKVNGKFTGSVENYIDVTSDESKDTNATSDSTELTNVSLTISKTVDVDSAKTGDYVTYTITVTNTGSSDAKNVYINDVLPNGLTYSSHNNDKWNRVDNDRWELIGDLTPETPATLTIVCLVDGTSIENAINTAYAGSSEVSDEVSDLSNSTELIDVQLDITKSVDKFKVLLNETLTYTITVTNTGLSSASNIVITDYIPKQLIIDYTGDSSLWDYDAVLNTWTYKGTLASGRNATLTLTFKINTDQVGLDFYVENKVNIDADDITESKNATSNQSYISIKTAQLNKTLNEEKIKQGEEFSFTISFTNTGNDNITGLWVQEYFPNSNDIEYLGWNNLGDNAWNDVREDYWTYEGFISPGQTVSFIVNFKALTKNGGSNLVRAGYEDLFDSNLQANAPVTISDDDLVPDVTITKTANVTHAKIGDIIEYTITVTSTGQTALTELVLTDETPNGLKFLGSDHGSWTINATSGKTVWTLNELATSSTIKVRYEVIGNVTGSILNIATIAANLTSNKTNVSVQITNPLLINKTVNVSQAQVGDLISYIIDIRNNGTTNVSDIKITDNFPPGLKLVDVIASTDWTTLDNITWTFNKHLNPNEESILQFIFEVDGSYLGVINNTVTVFDNETVNGTNATSENTTLTNVSLEVTKKVNQTSANKGDLINYTITVTNVGTTNATEVYVREYLNEFLELDLGKSSYDDWKYLGNGVWLLKENLESTKNASLILVFRIVGNVPVVNNTINTTTNQTPEGNNTTSDNTNVTYVDLEVIKLVNDTRVYMGDSITYTITITNIGNGNATGVTVYDYGPGNAVLTSNTFEAGWTKVSNTKWTYAPILEVGESVNLTLVYKLDDDFFGTVNNEVNVTTDQTPNGTTNKSNDTSVVLVNLTITKTTTDYYVLNGGTMVYTVYIENSGNDDLTNIVISDYFPGELSCYFIQGTNNFDYSSQTIGSHPYSGYIIRIPLLKSGQNGTFTFHMIVNANFVGNNNTKIINNTLNIIHDEVSEEYNVTSINTTIYKEFFNITKTVNATNATIGDLIKYNITITNLGPEYLGYSQAVYDIIHSGLTFDSCSWDSWRSVGNSYTFYYNYGMSPGESISLIVVFRVNGNYFGNITNTATWQEKNDTTNNTLLYGVNLTTSKKVNATNAKEGDTIHYNITITNNGNINATNVIVKDYIPEGLDRKTDNYGLWNYNNDGTWTYLGNITPGQTVLLQLEFLVNGKTSGILNNTVNVTTTETPNGTNTTSDNTFIENVTLDVIKTTTTKVAAVGDVIEYTITVTNIGSTDAHNVKIIEYFPEGLDFINDDHWIAQGWIFNGIDTFTYGDLSAYDGIATLVLKFTVNGKQTGSINNTVNTTSDETPEGKNATSENTILTNVSFDITKIANVTTANVGELVSYNITITNTGSQEATLIRVSDSLPDGLKLQTDLMNNPNWQRVGDTNVWEYIGTLKQGESASLILIFKVVGNVTTNVTNIATVKSNETPNGKNDSEDVNLTSVVLEINKTVNMTEARLNDLISYTVNIKNTGNSSATNVTIIEYVPNGLTFVEVADDDYWSDNQDGTWTYTRSLAKDEIINLTLIFKVTSLVEEDINNTVNITSDQTPDGNNTTSENTSIKTVTLSYAKEVNVTEAVIGDYIEYKVYVKNIGSITASNIVIMEYLPEGLDLINHTVHGWNVEFDDVATWTYRGSLRSNQTIVLTLVFRVNGDVIGNINNTVNVTTQQTPEGNNTTSENTTITGEYLNVSKKVNTSSAVFGDLIAYNITIKNTGNANSTNITLKDYFPTGLTYLDYLGDEWIDNEDGSWTFNGTLAINQSTTLIVYFKVNDEKVGIINNTVNVTTNQTPDGRNTTSDNTTIYGVIINTTKSVNTTTARFGDYISYNITITNLGNIDATNITIEDFFPEGLTLNETNYLNWTHIAGSSIWKYDGNLSAGESVSLILVFLVNGEKQGIVNNTVNVTTTETPNGTNTTSNDTNILNVNLTITKTPGANSVNIGEIINYTIVITNIGNDNATNVTVIDYIPNTLDCVGFVGDWTYNNLTGTWIYNNVLNAGETVELILIFRVNTNATTFINNTVNVTSNQTPDGKNASSNNTTITNVSLAIIKNTNVTKVNVNEMINYTVTVTNVGTSIANTVTIFDHIPAGLTYVSYLGDEWDYNNATGIWTYNGSLGINESVSIVLFFRVNANATGFLNNSVTIKTNETPGGHTNTSDDINITGVIFDITKIPSLEAVKIGDMINYTISIYNIGFDDATEVVLTDFIPEGLTYVDFVGDNWTYNKTTGKWYYANTLYVGEMIEIVLFFTVNSNASGVLNNTVNVASNETPTGSNATSNNTNVSKIETITTVNNVTGKPGDNVTINGTVTDEFDNPLNGTVIITLPDGSNVTVNVTDGEYSYNWTIPDDFKPGTYDVEVVFNGDDTYESSDATGIADVLKLSTVTTVSDAEGKPGEIVLITGTVHDERGNPLTGNVSLILPDGTVVIVEVIDGVFEYLWMIPKSFKAGSYPVFAEFIGDDFYLSSNATGTITVIVDPTPGPTPGPSPKPTDGENLIDEGNMQKTGNPIAILLLVLISALVLLPLKRRF
ncbi:Ig-like domain repeat protein [Methanobrevibacter sp. DSM 116169]|uniref:Ig-like domain repeat protein n=1 Tax=Methanobrevibacter sp. DSM 116169 TaxID=3242727 RepID=UPI0038FD3385